MARWLSGQQEVSGSNPRCSNHHPASSQASYWILSHVQSFPELCPGISSFISKQTRIWSPWWHQSEEFPLPVGDSSTVDRVRLCVSSLPEWIHRSVTSHKQPRAAQPSLVLILLKFDTVNHSILPSTLSDYRITCFTVASHPGPPYQVSRWGSTFSRCSTALYKMHHIIQIIIIIIMILIILESWSFLLSSQLGVSDGSLITNRSDCFHSYRCVQFFLQTLMKMCRSLREIQRGFHLYMLHGCLDESRNLEPLR